jgi:DNA (cytosine-5)-methyltransferase 1
MIDVDSYTEISLFSGYGGFSLGLRLAGLRVQTVCYVEIDRYCQSLIQARIRDGYLDDAPIWDDIKTFDGSPWCGSVDLLTAGFPCQPHSVAGQRKGVDDERNLWPDTLRVVREVGPRYVLLENVPGILANGYGGTVVGELSEAGYDCIWDCVSAAEAGAPHLRERWWCLATNTGGVQRDGGGREERDLLHQEREPQGDKQQRDRREYRISPVGEIVSNPATGRLQDSAHQSWHKGGKNNAAVGALVTGSSWWTTEPDVGRVAHGVTSRVDRLRALGNGIVPAVVREFFTGTCRT